MKLSELKKILDGVVLMEGEDLEVVIVTNIPQATYEKEIERVELRGTHILPSVEFLDRKVIIITK